MIQNLLIKKSWKKQNMCRNYSIMHLNVWKQKVLQKEISISKWKYSRKLLNLTYGGGGDWNGENYVCLLFSEKGKRSIWEIIPIIKKNWILI